MAIIDDFRENVVPRLKEAARVQAFFVALEFIEPWIAKDEVITLARKLGSPMLSSRDQDRLIDWIGETVWREIEKADDRVAVIEMRMDAAIADNPARFYDGLASRCSDPERMRLTFGAISKPYRDHLTRERQRARKA